MDDSQNNASPAVDSQHAAVDVELHSALIRAERMRDRATQIRNQSQRLREQAGIACKEAKALIDTFPPTRRAVKET